MPLILSMKDTIMKRTLCLILALLCFLPVFTACTKGTTYAVEEMKITLEEGKGHAAVCKLQKKTSQSQLVGSLGVAVGSIIDANNRAKNRKDSEHSGDSDQDKEDHT